MTVIKDRTLTDLFSERIRQNKKWGTEGHLPLFWQCIIAEEAGEVARAVLEKDFPQYRQELVQLAAAAIAAIESYDRLTGTEDKDQVVAVI